MKQYKTYLFDWDGCIAKSLDIWMNVYMDLYAKAGVKTNEEEILQNSWGNLENGPKYFGINDYKEFWNKILEEVKIKMQDVALYEGAKETLIVLKEHNANIAIVTSSEKRLLQSVIKREKLEDSIDIILSPTELEKPKPDAECVTKALEFFKSSPDKTIIIGDTGTDIKTGQNAGIDTALVIYEEDNKYHDPQKTLDLGPTHVIKSLKELLQQPLD